MDGADFHVRMTSLDQSFQEGSLESALEQAVALRDTLKGEPLIDGEQFAWVAYYELRALHGLKKWSAYVELMEGAGAFLTALGAMNQAYASSLTMEALANLGRYDEIGQWGVETCCLRLETEDADAFFMAFETACALIGQGGDDHMVEEFVRELAGEVGELGLKGLESHLLEFADKGAQVD